MLWFRVVRAVYNLGLFRLAEVSSEKKRKAWYLYLAVSLPLLTPYFWVTDSPSKHDIEQALGRTLMPLMAFQQALALNSVLPAVSACSSRCSAWGGSGLSGRELKAQKLEGVNPCWAVLL